MARILIAAPDETAAAVQAALVGTGHELCEVAGSADEALEIASDQRPDVALLDIDLGCPLGGIEVADRLRKLDVAVVFLTASASDDLVALAKAVRPSVAIALSNQLVERRRREVQRRKEEELAREIEELRALSLVDDLTGVLNRRGFIIHAEQAIRVSNRNREHLSVLFIDVDGLKQVNDREGHAAGDDLIRDTAAVLRLTLRDSDIIGRVGGDEFAVVAIGCTPQRMPELLARLAAQLEQHNASPGRRTAVSFSTGTVLHDPACPESIDALLARADAEMYAHKRGKRIVQAPA